MAKETSENAWKQASAIANSLYLVSELMNMERVTEMLDDVAKRVAALPKNPQNPFDLPMPSAVWKKAGRGKKEIVDWEATSQLFEEHLSSGASTSTAARRSRDSLTRSSQGRR